MITTVHIAILAAYMLPIALSLNIRNSGATDLAGLVLNAGMGGSRLISDGRICHTVLPDRCSVTEGKKQCVNPPEFIVSILAGKDEYMVGVACAKHKEIVSGKVGILQSGGRIHDGKITFSPVKAVGTDCIRADTDDLVNIDLK